jgi:hypothetical protein
MSASDRIDCRVRHYGATLYVRRNARAATNLPISVQIDGQIEEKVSHWFRHTDFT